MSPETVSPDCVLGVPEWADVVGFTNAEWAENDEPCAGDVWPRLDHVPTESHIYALRVKAPFPCTTDQAAWVIYQPALSSLNGWEEYPAEISGSCIVQIRVLHVLETQGTATWFRVRVERVIGFCAIARQAREARAGHPPSALGDIELRHMHVTNAGAFALFDSSVESDFGSWLVVEKRDGKHLLLVQGQWGQGTGHFFAGVRVLTEPEWATLNQDRI